MKYKTQFTLFKKMFRATVIANSPEDVKYKIMGKIEFTSIEEIKPILGNDSIFENLKNIMK